MTWNLGTCQRAFICVSLSFMFRLVVIQQRQYMFIPSLLATDEVLQCTLLIVLNLPIPI